MDKVAVVILNYNGKKHLEQFLSKVIEYSEGSKVIIADNCSTDDSLAYLKTNFPSVQLLEFKENGGFSKGYNDALKQIKAQYYVLLNNDVEVTPGWIEPVISLMDANPKIAACQPKIKSYHNKEFFEHAGAAGGYIDILGYPFCRGRIFDFVEKDLGQYHDSQKIFWASGAALFIRSEIYHSLGGLDEDFFAHMEEIDLCWRINNAGHEVYCCSDSEIFHVGGGTLNKSNPKKTYLNFRNSLFLLYKNSPLTALIWKIPFRFLLDLAASLRFLLINSYRDFYAVVKAWVHFTTQARKYSDKRKLALNNKKVNNEEINTIYHGMITVDYYLKSKKNFKDLNFF